MSSALQTLLHATAAITQAQNLTMGRSLAVSTGLHVPVDPQAALGYVSKYEVLATHPHDPKSFTQGLLFDECARAPAPLSYG